MDSLPPAPVDLTSTLALEPEPVQIEDLTDWLVRGYGKVMVEAIDVVLGKPRKAGKTYDTREEAPRQLPLLGDDEADTVCIHGMRKRYCASCIEKEKVKQAQTRVSHTVNPFDVILPILQPPLGENLDSPVAFPSGNKLYPFQREGVRFLAENEVALLSDEMGLGKSIQAIVALRLLVRKKATLSGIILCPKSVLTDWEKKLWQWAPELRVVKVRGSPDERQALWGVPAHVYLTTYETLSRDITSSLELATVPGLNLSKVAERRFDFAILDEIQNIKNPESNITRDTRKLNARIRWGLSGTPLENRIEELIAIFAYLKPELLRHEYANRPNKVKDLIRPYFLRRRKMDVSSGQFSSSEKKPEDVWLEISAGQRATYDRLESEGVLELNRLGSQVTVQHVLALITKLKQVCNLDPVTQESCKLEFLDERLEEISEQGDKALVFSQYPEKTLRFLQPKLTRYNPMIFDGSLSDSRRDQIINAFQQSDETKVLLMSVKAGGVGLTLTRANYAFHYDLWWNPAVASQAEDQAHRIGQNKTVFVFYLYTVGTIEERIHCLLKRKRDLFAQVIEDMSDRSLSGVLTEEELFSLFNLKHEKRSVGVQGQPGRKSATAPSLSELSPADFERLVAAL